MKNMRILLAVLLAVLAILCAAGCGEDDAVSPSDAAVSASAVADSDDDEAAKDTLQAYFDAFNAQDANAIADIVYSHATDATGMTREDIATMMQSSIDANVAQFGDGYRFVYDRAEFVCEDAAAQVDGINQSFGLAEAEIKVDGARIIRATVHLVDADGIEHEPETGSMLVYHYDGAWYLYGYAG